MATDLQEGVIAEHETAVGSIVAEKWNELERGSSIMMEAWWS
jgi:hypothetical protein